MPSPIRISHNGQTSLVHTLGALRRALAIPDRRGGGDFWLGRIDHAFPQLAIRTSRGQADVHYFPSEGHPGFRLLSGSANREAVAFQFEGCDPCDGELVPGEFVVPLEKVLDIAAHFMEGGSLHRQSNWFEL